MQYANVTKTALCFKKMFFLNLKINSKFRWERLHITRSAFKKKTLGDITLF